MSLVGKPIRKNSGCWGIPGATQEHQILVGVDESLAYPEILLPSATKSYCMAIAYNLIRLIHVELEQDVQIRFSNGARHLAETP
jgi:hypothetical protein